MSDIQPEHIVKKNTKSRRRKKRRTEDFSSSSSSSSSSESESENDQPETVEEPADAMEVDENKTPESTGRPYNEIEKIKASVQARLNQVQFTEDTVSAKQLREELRANETSTNPTNDNPELDQAYLQLMTSQFGDDLDELRKKPDFGQNSLMVLVEALKSSKNIFDPEELQELTSRQ